MKFVHDDSSLIILLVTHKPLLDAVRLLVDQLCILFPDEFKDIQSEHELFDYLALHLGWRNEYSENVSIFILNVKFECS